MTTPHYDILVAGGGLAGTFAAVAAAREGARTVLLEQYGFLGGMATAAPVSVFMQYHVDGEHEGEWIPLVRGLYEDMINRLQAAGAMLDVPFSFDDVALRGILDDLASEAGVDVFFHTFLADAQSDENRVHAVRIASKSGLQDLSANVFVDATGDGDLASRAGVKMRYGRADGKAQPMTPTFVVAGIDPERMPPKSKVGSYLQKAFDEGLCSVPGVSLWPTPYPDAWFFNTSHVWDHSAIDVRELSRAEMIGRQQIRVFIDALRQHVPGFEKAYVSRAGVQIGVRESRHLVGRYTLTRDDVEQCRHFDDGIARCSFEVDIHDMGDGETHARCVLPRGQFYEIPYRCLLPAGPPDNLLVACRALSADHGAHGSLRIMPTMAAVGEAAGLAAAHALQQGGQTGMVDGTELKQELLVRQIMGLPSR